MTEQRLLGKRVIVTGATAGIGEAISRRFAHEGASLTLVSRGVEAGLALVADLPPGAVFVAGDVADSDTASRAVAAARDAFGGVDVLVNNAASDFYGEFLDADREDVRRLFEVNFFGQISMIQASVPAMRGGCIVNVASRTAVVGVPTMAIYGASKGALLSLTRALAVELAPKAIRVNAVLPGLTRTPLVEAWLASSSDPTATEAAAVAEIPLGRLATPEDVAATILFLASDEAAYITGAALPVDGGFTAR